MAARRVVPGIDRSRSTDFGDGVVVRAAATTTRRRRDNDDNRRWRLALASGGVERRLPNGRVQQACEQRSRGACEPRSRDGPVCFAVGPRWLCPSVRAWHILLPPLLFRGAVPLSERAWAGLWGALVCPPASRVALCVTLWSTGYPVCVCVSFGGSWVGGCSWCFRCSEAMDRRERSRSPVAAPRVVREGLRAAVEVIVDTIVSIAEAESAARAPPAPEPPRVCRGVCRCTVRASVGLCAYVPRLSGPVLRGTPRLPPLRAHAYVPGAVDAARPVYDVRGHGPGHVHVRLLRQVRQGARLQACACGCKCVRLSCVFAACDGRSLVLCVAPAPSGR